jgi:CheY-like chemotaxis protein
VEDNEPTVEALTRMLRMFGAEVTAVGSADEAIAAFQAKQPDIIVSDIGLPKQDGFEFMKRLRALEVESKMSPTPAVALSAFAGEKHRRQALESGYQTYLPKPARTNSLLNAISDCLGRKNGDNS